MHKKRGCAILAILLVLFMGVFAAILWVGVSYFANLYFGPAANSLTGFDRWNFSRQVLDGKAALLEPANALVTEVEFTISPQESVSSIASRLQEAGLIRDARAFRAYLVYKGLDSQVKAGTFNLSSGMNAVEIARAIQSVYSDIVPFYIYPGWRAEEIAAALPTSGIEVDPAEFLRLVHHPAQASSLPAYREYPSLDGFLFPGEYEVNRKTTAEGLIKIFVTRFEEKVTPETIQSIKDQGLSLYQGITLASIIQRETFQDSERGLMASVFYNRLRDGIRLETDPTVQYALGYSEKWGNWWKTPLKTGDLSVDSPYNTYLITGLPPTPISNPDLPSILAVAYPESSSYYYFRARCDDSGLHDFSVTFEEHNSKSCQ